jgi:tetratricopeptide (TPR) repeat protein
VSDALWRLVPRGAPSVPGHRLLYEIGRGGMGAVFLAERLGSASRTFVAVKTIGSLEGVRKGEVDQLLSEARVLERLRSESVARLIEVKSGELPYLIMEYVHGDQLSELLDRAGRLPIEVVGWIGSRVAGALDEAHRSHVIHRDISPQNVILGYDGKPKLVDFGIAWSKDRSEITAAGVIKGRLRYMSPEQRSGLELDARSDLYSLGVVMIEAILGLRKEALEIGDRTIADLLPRIEAPGLEALLRRMIAPEREARISSAKEVSEALVALFGPDRSRELSEILARHPSDRRATKEELIGAIDLRNEDTEALPLKPVEVPQSKRSKRRMWVAPLFAFAAATVIGLAIAKDPPISIGARPCVLGVPSLAPEDRDASWLATRLVAEQLRRAGREPIHGYRAEDRLGWNDEGLARASALCAEAGAKSTLEVEVAGPRIELTVGSGGRRRALEREGSDLAEVAAGLLRDLGIDPESRSETLDRGYEALVHAREHLWKARYGEAIAAAGAAIRVNPRSEEAYLIRALASWWSGRLDDASVRTAELRAPEGSSTELARLFGVLGALIEDRKVEACEGASSILSGSNEDPYAIYVAGEALVHGCDPSRGAEALARALALRPELEPARYHVVRAFSARAAWADLERLADDQRRFDPSASRSTLDRAAIRVGQGRYAEAAKLYSEVLAKEPTSSEATVGIAHVRALEGDLEGALARLDKIAAGGGAEETSSLLLGYVLAIVKGSEDEIAARRSKIDQRLGREQTASLRHLGASAAIVELLADRPSRSLPPPDRATPRSYRFESFERIAGALEARRTKDPAALASFASEGPPLAKAIALGGQGDAANAERELLVAIEESVDGDVDCIAHRELALLRKARGDEAGARAACDRVEKPRVPTAYCHLLRPRCGR